MKSWDTRVGDKIDVRVVSADNRDDPEYALDVGDMKVTKSGSKLTLHSSDGELGRTFIERYLVYVQRGIGTFCSFFGYIEG